MTRAAKSDDARQIMVRVGAVLDPSGKNRLQRRQKDLFNYLSEQIAHYGADRKCPIVSIVDHVGNYWRNWLLVLLRTGPHRPSTIIKLLEAIDPSHPISHRMLTLNVRMLERDGLIARQVIADDHNHVEYDLTDIGRSLSDQIMALVDWAQTHSDAVERARNAFDAEEWS